MDDSWAVLYGAGVALVASILGGVLAGPWLTRRADERVRVHQASDAAREVVRGALRDIAIGLHHWLGGKTQGDAKRAAKGEQVVVEAQTTFRLWTSHEEREIESSVYGVLAAEDAPGAVVLLGTWEACAALWFRGELDATKLGREFREGVERNAAKAEAWRTEINERSENQAPKGS